MKDGRESSADLIFQIRVDPSNYRHPPGSHSPVLSSWCFIGDLYVSLTISSDHGLTKTASSNFSSSRTSLSSASRYGFPSRLTVSLSAVFRSWPSYPPKK